MANPDDDRWGGNRYDEHGRDAGYNDYGRPRDDYDDRGGSYGSPPNIPNHLGYAIFVTLCCCVPLGIVSIVMASQVNTHLSARRYAEARKASDNAKLWATIGLVLGLIGNVIGLALQAFIMQQDMQRGRGF